nr:hypothetical protein [uncultured Trichococcus sp.]
MSKTPYFAILLNHPLRTPTPQGYFSSPHCNEIFNMRQPPSSVVAMDSVWISQSFSSATPHEVKVDDFLSGVMNEQQAPIMMGSNHNGADIQKHTMTIKLQPLPCFDYFLSISHHHLKSNIKCYFIYFFLTAFKTSLLPVPD